MKIKELYNRIMTHHGFRYQLRKLQEECNELGAAINHFCTKRNDGDAHLHEEFVDVEIMMEQIRPFLDPKKLSSYRRMKLQNMTTKMKRKAKNGKGRVYNKK